ncbi:Protein of unknown function D [Prunus dulcis]|uniref:FLZ-type domain-containing protein n=1 Tax=Prunus dulcis TaxID=3755 RepID=A0A4Y1QLL6_PRUDU|nr:Protein of unknown function D [Prunus dulcis]
MYRGMDELTNLGDGDTVNAQQIGQFISQDFDLCYELSLNCKIQAGQAKGEKAFCSTECRDKHIRSDDHKEKCRSEAIKSMDYSVSPCSSPLVFLAGVAVA